MNLFDSLIVLIILIVFSLISYRKKSLDAVGTVIAVVVGAVTFYLGGLAYFFVMVVFFVTAESCTRFARRELKEKSEKRTTGNILGNSGAALIGLFLGYPIAFFGAIATALADTVSSELGMLSPHKPRLITNLKEVEPGTDGGVTLLGLASAIIGASIVAMLYFAINGLANPGGLVLITFSGFFGSVIDSVLGAVFERRGWLNNTGVNFLASASGAVLAVVFAGFFGIFL